MTDPASLDFLCRILRDEPAAWPGLDASAAHRLYDTAREQGVHLLVADRLWERGELEDCPRALRDRLAASLRSQLAVEEIARQELQTVLAAFGDAGIHPVLFKGAALAFTHYPDPVLRPRVDTDLLVDPSERLAAFETLERLHYQRPPFQTGDLVMYQVPYGRTDGHGARHVVDLHWKVSNPQVFARAVTREELVHSSVRVPQLGDTARAPSAVHSLVLGCVHRVAHHGHEERLIWILDIHLLAERLSEGEREEFVEFAVAKHLTTVCAQGLEVAERRFHGRAANRLLAQLVARLSENREPSEPYARGRMRKVDVLLSDLDALEGWRPRFKLLREHLFPPGAYMRQAYGASSAAWLPFLYAWRFARGARAWCTRGGVRL